MKIYTLTIIKETMDEPANVEIKLYANPEDAIKAYGNAFDEAQLEADGYEKMWQDDEIATDTPYRWWKVYDEGGNYSSITIELDTKEVI